MADYHEEYNIPIEIVGEEEERPFDIASASKQDIVDAITEVMEKRQSTPCPKRLRSVLSTGASTSRYRSEPRELQFEDDVELDSIFKFV